MAPSGGRATELEEHVEAFLEHLVEARKASPSTVRAYAADLGQFFSFLRGRAPGEPLSELSVRLFLGGLADAGGGAGRAGGARAATASRKLAAIKAFFRHLCEEGVILENPAAMLAGPRPGRRPAGPRHLEDLAALLELPGGGPVGLRDSAVLEALLVAGVRPSDLYRLDVEDVDVAGETLRIPGRGRGERLVAFGSAAGCRGGRSGRRSALADYVAGARGELLRRATGPGTGTRALFVNRSGGRLSQRGLRRLVDRYVERLAARVGVPADEMRRRLGQRLLEAGVETRAVREILGRDETRVAAGGILASPERLRAVYEKAHPRA